MLTTANMGTQNVRISEVLPDKWKSELVEITEEIYFIVHTSLSNFN
jgi:hypothetical protein